MSTNSPGMTGEDRDRSMSGCRITRPRFKPKSSEYEGQLTTTSLRLVSQLWTAAHQMSHFGSPVQLHVLRSHSIYDPPSILQRESRNQPTLAYIWYTPVVGKDIFLLPFPSLSSSHYFSHSLSLDHFTFIWNCLILFLWDIFKVTSLFHALTYILFEMS
jgi:hypothetical protein